MESMIGYVPKKAKRPLEKNEEFIEYKYVDLPNGEGKKRKRVIKRTIKSVK